MKIWITNDTHSAVDAAAKKLADTHEVIVSPNGTDLREPEQVAPLVAGVDAVVHTAAPSGPVDTDETLLDLAARGAYVILDAAVQAGVPRAVLISSLDSFADYPDTYVIDETWRPRPRPDAASFAPLMAERTFREFARQGPIETVCLRFHDDDTPEGLAANAIERALTMQTDADAYRWWLYHVAVSERFPMRAATGRPLSLEVTE